MANIKFSELPTESTFDVLDDQLVVLMRGFTGNDPEVIRVALGTLLSSPTVADYIKANVLNYVLGGAGISTNYDSGTGELTITSDAGVAYTDEDAIAAVAAALVAGNDGIQILDDGETITIFNEYAPLTSQDVIETVASALVAGSNVTITDNTGVDGTIEIEFAGGGGSYSDEEARDAIAAALVAGSGINITVNDAANTITIEASGGGGGGSSPYDGAIIVASSQAPADVRANAHHVCDGTDDDVQINAAIVDANATTGNGGQTGGEQGGTVLLTGGRFNIGSPIKMRTGVTLRGQGRLTELLADGLGSSAVIEQNAATDHVYVIRDLWINGGGSAGGTGSAIHLASTQGASRGSYPGTNPDPDIWIDGLLITDCSNGTTRNGIWMDTDQRGTMISNTQIQDCSLHGIFIDSTPDSHLTNIHIGNIKGDGFRIAGGNVKVVNCKAYYCDGNGFNITSGRGIVSACESQDNVVGFRIAAAPVTCSALVCDTSHTDGIIVAANRCVIAGFNIFQRAGRDTWPTDPQNSTCLRGITFSSAVTDCSITGVVDTTDIGTEVSGTYTGSRNFIRISNGASLLSVG